MSKTAKKQSKPRDILRPHRREHWLTRYERELDEHRETLQIGASCKQERGSPQVRPGERVLGRPS